MVKVVRFANGLVFEWHLNIVQKSPVFEWPGCVITIMLRIAILMYYHLKSEPDFKWLNYLKTRHWKVRYSGVRYSDGYCTTFWISGRDTCHLRLLHLHGDRPSKDRHAQERGVHEERQNANGHRPLHSNLHHSTVLLLHGLAQGTPSQSDTNKIRLA